MLNAQTLKNDFPIFRHQPNLVYLDAAATSLKPQVVIDAERAYLEQYSANVGRGLYPLAEQATEVFEQARAHVARFIGAQTAQEIIFTSGTTASINMVACFLEHTLHTGDNIVMTVMEHHSNYLPWKELARRKKIELRIAPLTKAGALDCEALLHLVDARTKIVAFSAVSNVLGTINPTQEIITAIKNIQPTALTLVDAAQAIGHLPIDVTRWNADLVAFSAHKCFGPTGVGVLYGKTAVLNTLYPTSFGGGMVLDVCQEKPVYKEIPYRFESGTPNIAGVIAFGAALEYIDRIGIENIHSYEMSLVSYAIETLRGAFGDDITILGPPDTSHRSNILSFSFVDVHPHDIAHLLGEQNICVLSTAHSILLPPHAFLFPSTIPKKMLTYSFKN